MDRTRRYGPWLELYSGFYNRSSSRYSEDYLCECGLHDWFVFPRGAKVRLFVSTRYICQKTYLYDLGTDVFAMIVTYAARTRTRDVSAYLLTSPYEFLESAHRKGYHYLGLEYQEID